MKKFAMIAAALLAAGCSSSGDGPKPDRGMCIWGSGSCGDPEPPRWTTVSSDGIGAETTYRSDGRRVTSVGPIGATGSASAAITYSPDGNPTKLVVDGPSTSRTWDTTLGATVTNDGSFIEATSANSQDIAVTANPAGQGFEHQTFGAWQTGRGTAAGTAGVFSVGTETEGPNVPRSGTGIFTGIAGGMYVDPDGGDHVVHSNAALEADFANRRATFTTTGSQISGISTPQLDLAGTLTYGAGSNAMTGTVTSAGMTGSADGRFYGRNADEAGGVFQLRGTGVETYGGAFGTKRQ